MLTVVGGEGWFPLCSQFSPMPPSGTSSNQADPHTKLGQGIRYGKTLLPYKEKEGSSKGRSVEL